MIEAGNDLTHGLSALSDERISSIDATREELGSVWEECRVAGWDGHEALPVEQSTLRNAFTFLETLTAEVPSPSIGAEPDGSLTFEWYRTNKHVLSVSVDASDELHFAALIGPSRISGILKLANVAKWASSKIRVQP